MKFKLSCGASMTVDAEEGDPHLAALALGHRLVGCAACNPRLRKRRWWQRGAEELTGLERELSTATKE